MISIIGENSHGSIRVRREKGPGRRLDPQFYLERLPGLPFIEIEVAGEPESAGFIEYDRPVKINGVASQRPDHPFRRHFLHDPAGGQSLADGGRPMGTPQLHSVVTNFEERIVR